MNTGEKDRSQRGGTDRSQRGDGDRSRQHEALVSRLVADAHPVRRLWPPAVRMAVWMALAAATAGVFAARNHLPTTGTRLSEPLFATQVASLLVAACWCGWLTLCAAVPGREPRTPAVVATILLVGSSILLAFGLAPETLGDPRSFVQTGTMCTGVTLGLGSIPWIAGLVALRRGAPVGPRLAAALAGSAALLTAAAAMRTVCPLGDARWHWLAWHVLPIAAAAVVSAALAHHLIRPQRKFDFEEA